MTCWTAVYVSFVLNGLLTSYTLISKAENDNDALGFPLLEGLDFGSFDCANNNGNLLVLDLLQLRSRDSNDDPMYGQITLFVAPPGGSQLIPAPLYVTIQQTTFLTLG